VMVVHARAEDAGRHEEHRLMYDVALSRAVAKLNVLVELCLPFVKKGGYFAALKGAQFSEEIDEARHAIVVLVGEISRVKSIVLPGLNDVRVVVYIQKVGTTPTEFPRRAGMPEKKPL
jgi:16S rRNA (guanine527-N7)-methyltransferase